MRLATGHDLVIAQRNKRYRDRAVPGRRLLVKEVVKGDPFGREVRGVIEYPGDPTDGRRYACDRIIFAKVWEDTHGAS